MLEPHRLAELMAARIFHDLGSPMASITAILPQATDPAAHAILMETAGELRARMKLFSAAFGHGDDLGWAELGLLLQGAPMAHRVRFELPGAAGLLSAGRVRLMLSLALLTAEALPRGGVVHIAEDSPGWVTFLPEGRDAAWSPTLAELMAGGEMEAALADGPRRVLAPWALAQAAAEGMELSFALGVGQAVAPLRLGPPG
ncbi:histidine phosphotransferase family protein [Sediminicoccus rosea]|jgi:histidine phosphotransferase ChpT|uniref:Histidine phosphotransferase family protein n=1 Tax=Sediminicoccus rosea TaxID=1225128 RepID=A0ABZ0PIY1_9PROT|nr:histidine phosphotransferase family protein [Sediminicoccus rosea]WPB85680.1 histidine phosphotransferase family protein [Sediminicoccus rosea]